MVQLELNRVSFYRPGPPVGLTAGMVLVQHKGLKFKLKFFFTLRVGVVVWSRFDVPPGQKRRYGVMGIRGRAGAKGMPVWVTKILLTAWLMQNLRSACRTSCCSAMTEGVFRHRRSLQTAACETEIRDIHWTHSSELAWFSQTVCILPGSVAPLRWTGWSEVDPELVQISRVFSLQTVKHNLD